MKALDRTGKLFLIACAVLFLGGVIFRLNGSSVYMWKQLLHDPSDDGGLLLAAPQAVRTDEWMVWTPAARWQWEHGFPSDNPSLGSGKTPFLYSLPVKHYTMVFRPQLWGFFLFSFERGYAWYWNTKVFGLLAAMFLFFWRLTGKSSLSLFAAFWLFFSSYIQWWFSCPPMLPEMLSSWAMALITALAVVKSTSWQIRLSAGAGCAASLMSFVLCLYPPFQIPLTYLGVALFIALVYRERAEIQLDWQRWASLMLVLFSTAALLLPFFLECSSTFQMLAATSYPGQRRSYGGELSWIQLFSGLVNFFNSPTFFPAGLKSASEAANFFPLWAPMLALTAPRLWKDPRGHPVAIGALLIILGLSAYALLPLPHWLCDLTALRYCTEVRTPLTIGLANIVFVTATLPLLALEKGSKRILCLAAASVAVLFYIVEEARGTALFSVGNAMFLLLDVTLLAVFFKGRVRAFAVCLIGLLVASNALVNPVMNGLGPLTISPPAVAVRELTKADPKGNWAAFDCSGYSEFLMAEGANVVSGLKLLPDLTFYGMADPTAASRDVYNRYSIGVFQYRPDTEKVKICSAAFPLHFVNINPRHRALTATGVRYFVFEQEIANPAKAGLRLLRALPDNRMWIYGLDPGTTSL